MEDYIFKANLDRCQSIEVPTTCLEILTYSDPAFDTIEEQPLGPGDFKDFLYRRGAFCPAALPDGVTLSAGIRLFVQQNTKNPKIFAPNTITLRSDAYTFMFEAMRLPFRAIECTSIVGPLFWSSWDQQEEHSWLQIIYRRADAHKGGETRGWELILSHDLHTSTTCGFYRGSASSQIGECLQHLKSCTAEISHSMTLPIIIYSHEVSSKSETKQRDVRDKLKMMEHILSMNADSVLMEKHVSESVTDLDALRGDLVVFKRIILQKRPSAYIRILDYMSETALEFYGKLPRGRQLEMERVYDSLLPRLDLYRKKWQGIETYAHTNMTRLDLSSDLLYNLIAQKESKLNLLMAGEQIRMAGEQKKLAIAAKRDTTTTKALSLLGTIFLPGAFLASMFSSSFFNFRTASDPGSFVSPRFWIYWAVTIPATAIIVGAWYQWEKRRARRYKQEEADVEKDVETGWNEMEKKLMEEMRERAKVRQQTRTEERKAMDNLYPETNSRKESQRNDGSVSKEAVPVVTITEFPGAS